ncbi:hypothetical protein HDU86_007839 [Geranomyces michiganensis]|nr:hypothetical protein HDU86_007839 [Geranomyces michiganensis]
MSTSYSPFNTWLLKASSSWPARPTFRTRPKRSPLRCIYTGPRDAANLKAVPFTLSPSEAEQRFRQHHEGWLTTSKALKNLKTERFLIPFWVFRATLNVYLTSAQLGFAEYHMEYDFQRKEYRRVRRTRWEARGFSNTLTSTRELEGTESAAQTYASFRFRKEYVEGVRAPSVWLNAKPIQAVDIPPGVQADAFNMSARAAWERVVAQLRSEEEQKVEELLKRETGAQEVRALQLVIEVTPPRGSGETAEATPVFLATYCFSGEYRGMVFNTFVNASTGQAGGQFIPQAERVGLLAGVGSTLVGLATGAFWGVGSGFFFWFFIPAVVGMLVARYWPLLWAGVYEGRRQWEQAKAAAFEQNAGGGGPQSDSSGGRQRSQQQRESWWEEARRRANSAGGQQQTWGSSSRRTAGSSGRSASAGPAGANSRDPLGYYAALGVAPTASVQEIQGAFRGLALKQHPDRVPPEQKAKATAQFQKLTEAYTVLRDPKQRRNYDSRGMA